MGLGSSVIKVIITGESEGFHREAGKAEKSADGLGSKLKGGLAAGYAAVGVAAIAAAGYVIKSGMELQESQDKLGQALKNSGTTWDKNKTAIEAAVKANEHYGTTAVETENLLTRGVTSTGSLSKATKLLALSQDIAAASGKPLADVYGAVTKASQGQLKPLKMLGIDLPIAAGGALKVKKAQDGLAAATEKLRVVQEKIHHGLLKGPAAYTALMNAQGGVHAAQKKLNDAQSAGGNILDALSKKFHGQADVAADSLKGKMKELHAKFQDFAAHIGVKLIPILTKWLDYSTKKIIPMLQKAAEWLGKHKVVLAALVIAIGLLVAPWFTVVAALIYAYTHFEKFRDIVNTTLATTKQWIEKFVSWAQAFWNNFGQSIFIYAKTWFGAVKSFIKGILEVIRGIIQVVTALIHGDWGKAWDGIKMIFKGVWDAIGGILRAAIAQVKLVLSLAWDAIGNTVRNTFNGIVGFFESLPGRLGSAALAMGKAIYNGIKSGVSGALGFVGDIARGFMDMIDNFIIDPIRNVHIKWGGFHGFGAFDIHPFDFIPRLHTGGIYEGGRSGEGLALLKNGEGVFTPGQMAALGAAMSTGGGGRVVINMPAGVDPAAVIRAQNRYNRRNGIR